MRWYPAVVHHLLSEFCPNKFRFRWVIAEKSLQWRWHVKAQRELASLATAAKMKLLVYSIANRRHLANMTPSCNDLLYNAVNNGAMLSTMETNKCDGIGSLTQYLLGRRRMALASSSTVTGVIKCCSEALAHRSRTASTSSLKNSWNAQGSMSLHGGGRPAGCFRRPQCTRGTLLGLDCLTPELLSHTVHKLRCMTDWSWVDVASSTSVLFVASWADISRRRSRWFSRRQCLSNQESDGRERTATFHAGISSSITAVNTSLYKRGHVVDAEIVPAIRMAQR